MSILDNTFFKLLQQQDIGQTRYQAYQSKYTRSTMVLFSKKTKTPLAALVLTASDPGVLALLTSRQSPKGVTDTYFQGMLSLPDQEIQLSIVNLAEEGMINFNVLHIPHRVSEVDPGPAYGINKVNELQPGQSYTIPADQRTGRVMILSGLTNTNQSDGKTEQVSVKDAESTPQRQGLYFYLSVVPQQGVTSLVDKFKEGTKWECVPYIVRRVEVPRTMTKGWFRGVEIPETGYDLMAVSSPPGQSVRNNHGIPESSTYFDRDRGNLLCLSDTSRLRTLDNDSFPMDISSEPEKRLVATKNLSNVAKSAHESVNIGQTQAGQLQWGRAVEVKSGFTGLEYEYNIPSNPTVLCLSIHLGMKFFAAPNYEQLAQAEIQDWICNEGKNILARLVAVYKSDNCVIDLESAADTIIAQCGHQCLNAKNAIGLTKCPLCRGHIDALIRVDTSQIVQ